MKRILFVLTAAAVAFCTFASCSTGDTDSNPGAGGGNAPGQPGGRN
ncbi:MAG: hypothetical protein PUI24_09395 [Spirochaetales bacterium]|nr:hypothetical protein [Spirochaetia bacterium]MDD7015178.1 hypothetical protein [Spirochaetales bacterium]